MLRIDIRKHAPGGDHVDRMSMNTVLAGEREIVYGVDEFGLDRQHIDLTQLPPEAARRIGLRSCDDFGSLFHPSRTRGKRRDVEQRNASGLVLIHPRLFSGEQVIQVDDIFKDYEFKGGLPISRPGVLKGFDGVAPRFQGRTVITPTPRDVLSRSHIGRPGWCVKDCVDSWTGQRTTVGVEQALRRSRTLDRAIDMRCSTERRFGTMEAVAARLTGVLRSIGLLRASVPARTGTVATSARRSVFKGAAARQADKLYGHRMLLTSGALASWCATTVGPSSRKLYQMCKCTLAYSATLSEVQAA